MNLVDLVMSQVKNPENLSKLGAAAGMDENMTSSALSNLIPMVTKMLGKQGESGIGNLMDMAANSGQGANMVTELLGSKMGMVTQLLGKTANMDSGQSNNFLTELVPMVMGALGQEKANQGLDTSAFTNLLNKSNDEVAQNNSQFGAIASLLDQDGDGEITDDLLNIGKNVLGGLFK